MRARFVTRLLVQPRTMLRKTEFLCGVAADLYDRRLIFMCFFGRAARKRRFFLFLRGTEPPVLRAGGEGVAALLFFAFDVRPSAR